LFERASSPFARVVDANASIARSMSRRASSFGATPTPRRDASTSSNSDDDDDDDDDARDDDARRIARDARDPRANDAGDDAGDDDSNDARARISNERSRVRA